MLRVKHAVELIRLQRDLETMVDEKTKENENLFLHVVESLADAIDAKDNYTKGHSGRVADYSKKIAERYGYDEKRQEKIFMMGLLHDVGKIGVPDEVINKPGRLTDEEFACIKKGFAAFFVISLTYVIVSFCIFSAEAAEPAVLPFAVVLYLKVVDEYPVSLGELRRTDMTRICTCTENLACEAYAVCDTVTYFKKIYPKNES